MLKVRAVQAEEAFRFHGSQHWSLGSWSRAEASGQLSFSEVTSVCFCLCLRHPVNTELHSGGDIPPWCLCSSGHSPHSEPRRRRRRQSCESRVFREEKPTAQPGSQAQPLGKWIGVSLWEGPDAWSHPAEALTHSSRRSLKIASQKGWVGRGIRPAGSATTVAAQDHPSPPLPFPQTRSSKPSTSPPSHRMLPSRLFALQTLCGRNTGKRQYRRDHGMLGPGLSSRNGPLRDAL